nr:hypothetical protein [uncultured Oscillibacter sp.]
MNGKKVSLTGEVHISTGSVYTTVDALEALKCIGLAYGVYDHAEELRNARVRLEDGDKPALVVQEDVSHHGTPLWETVRVITDDPEQIHRYLAFRETVKMLWQMEAEQSRQATPEMPLMLLKKKGEKSHER